MQTKILPAKYIMKTDDDAFVRIDEVLSSLKGKATKGLLYGLISFESSPDRQRDSKWYIDDEVFTSNLSSRFAFTIDDGILFIFASILHAGLVRMRVLFVQEWPHASYPPWAHGPGYIISRDIAKFIVRSHHERDLKVKKLLAYTLSNS